MGFSSTSFIEHAKHYLIEDYPRRIAISIADLSEEELWWAPNEQSNSIGNLILHLMGNCGQWLHQGIGNITFNRDRPVEFSKTRQVNKEKLLEDFENSIEVSKLVLEKLKDDDLESRVEIQGFDTNKYSALVHLVEHFAMHTGQIIYISKMIKNIDLEFYQLADGKAKPTWKDSGI